MLLLTAPSAQVERLDNPSLQGVPLAVQQYNAGGFVAVSYEVCGLPFHLNVSKEPFALCE